MKYVVSPIYVDDVSNGCWINNECWIVSCGIVGMH